MTTPYPNLFAPFRLGSLTLRNRIVNTVHGTGLSEARELPYLAQRARGGAALLGLHSGPGVYEFGLGPGEPTGQADWDAVPPDLWSAEAIAAIDEVTIPALARKATTVHNEGALCYAQVYHSGAGRHRPSTAPLVGPSTVPDPYEGGAPHPLSSAEIDALIDACAQQIRRIHQAGVDAAELHAAHGYLLHQFLSPHFNRRTDRWGGNAEGRTRLLRDIVDKARTLVPADFPIGVRVGLDGTAHDRRLRVEDLVECCALLDPHAAFISVSSGSYTGIGDGVARAYVSSWYTEPAFNTTLSKAVRDAVRCPVIVTGRITDPSTADHLVASGAADLVGMVRALIADPDLPNKASVGRDESIRMCLGMSECHAVGSQRVPLTCAVNPAAARERELLIRPTRRQRTVAIVGAGPAGMEAARTAAQAGHRVYLADAARQIGGLPRVLAVDERRRNLLDQAAYYEVELRRLGVELLLGNRVTADEFAGFDADEHVIATGGRPIVPEVAGIDGRHVVQAVAVLGGAPTSDAVIVVGGTDAHLGPPTIAEFLAVRGRHVTLISSHFDFAPHVEDVTRFELRRRLARAAVTVQLASTLRDAADGSAVISDDLTGEVRTHRDVTIVLACGQLPDSALADAVRGRVASLHVIGDALAPRRIMHATLDGARLGVTLGD